MEKKEIITILVSQIPVLLLGIGYFIKRSFDNDSKKIEVNHTLFQQYRLTALNRFFNSYSKAVALWKHILIYKVVSREYDIKKMDDLTNPILVELESSLFELSVFFDESDYIRFEILIKNIWKIHRKLVDLYLESDSIMSQSTKANNYYLFKTEVLGENNIILDELTKSMKYIFKT